MIGFAFRNSCNTQQIFFRDTDRYDFRDLKPPVSYRTRFPERKNPAVGKVFRNLIVSENCTRFARTENSAEVRQHQRKQDCGRQREHQQDQAAPDPFRSILKMEQRKEHHNNTDQQKQGVKRC